MVGDLQQNINRKGSSIHVTSTNIPLGFTGSFGVAEDQFFKKASEYARLHGLPRVYIACNSGARVGLVEELLPKLRIHWKDVEDPSKADRGLLGI